MKLANDEPSKPLVACHVMTSGLLVNKGEQVRREMEAGRLLSAIYGLSTHCIAVVARTSIVPMPLPASAP